MKKVECATRPGGIGMNAVMAAMAMTMTVVAVVVLGVAIDLTEQFVLMQWCYNVQVNGAQHAANLLYTSAVQREERLRPSRCLKLPSTPSQCFSKATAQLHHPEETESWKTGAVC